MANATIKEAMDSYRSHLIAKGRKENTVSNNIQPVKHLWRSVGDIQVASLRPHHMDRFFTQGNWSPSTRNLYLGNLRQFFQYCRRMNFLPKDADPTDGWNANHVPKVDRLVVPVEEFADLLDAAEHPRDRAMVALGLFTFCRSSELVNLRVDDLDFQRHTVSIFRVKTQQFDVLPMCTELEEEILRWLAYYSRAVGGTQSHYYLVPALAQLEMVYNPVTRLLGPASGIQKIRPTSRVGHPYVITQRALTKLGYDTKRAGGHTLRRSGARALYDQLCTIGHDGALRQVGSMLGHADTKTTEIYLQAGLERKQRNSLLAGKAMFPDLVKTSKVTLLKEA